MNRGYTTLSRIAKFSSIGNRACVGQWGSTHTPVALSSFIFFNTAAIILKGGKRKIILQTNRLWKRPRPPPLGQVDMPRIEETERLASRQRDLFQGWSRACSGRFERRVLFSIQSVSVTLWWDSKSACMLHLPAIWAALRWLLGSLRFDDGNVNDNATNQWFDWLNKEKQSCCTWGTLSGAMFCRSLPNDDVKFSHLRFWRQRELAAVNLSLFALSRKPFVSSKRKCSSPILYNVINTR